MNTVWIVLITVAVISLAGYIWFWFFLKRNIVVDSNNKKEVGNMKKIYWTVVALSSVITAIICLKMVIDLIPEEDSQVITFHSIGLIEEDTIPNEDTALLEEKSEE
ncbi:MAG: hypothetical protein AAB688_02485 [Patescibacteria group bacterium]